MMDAPEPHAHVSRLHRLPHDSHQIVAQGIEVRLVPELRGEALKSFPRIILTSVEAPVYESLDASS